MDLQAVEYRVQMPDPLPAWTIDHRPWAVVFRQVSLIMDNLRMLLGDDATALVLCAAGLGLGLLVLQLAGWFRSTGVVESQSEEAWQLPADLLPVVAGENIRRSEATWHDKAA
jgi:hypothetical protein